MWIIVNNLAFWEKKNKAEIYILWVWEERGPLGKIPLVVRRSLSLILNGVYPEGNINFIAVVALFRLLLHLRTAVCMVRYRFFFLSFFFSFNNPPPAAPSSHS